MLSTKSGGGGCDFERSSDGEGGSPGATATAAASSATSPAKNNHHLAYQHGHSFIKKTFHKPTNYCHYCSELLWGLMGQGYACDGKNIRPRRGGDWRKGKYTW